MIIQCHADMGYDNVIVSGIDNNNDGNILIVAGAYRNKEYSMNNSSNMKTILITISDTHSDLNIPISQIFYNKNRISETRVFCHI